jgi:hypothetical protein
MTPDVVVVRWISKSPVMSGTWSSCHSTEGNSECRLQVLGSRCGASAPEFADLRRAPSWSDSQWLCGSWRPTTDHEVTRRAIRRRAQYSAPGCLGVGRGRARPRVTRRPRGSPSCKPRGFIDTLCKEATGIRAPMCQQWLVQLGGAVAELGNESTPFGNPAGPA